MLWYAFLQACNHGYISLISKFLKEGIVVVATSKDNLDSEDESINGILLDSDYCDTMIDNKQWEALDILLEYGLNFGEIQWKLRHTLSTTGDKEGFARWIKKGLNIRDSYADCLRYATDRGHSDLVCYLVERGATVNVTEYVEDWPPIVHAVRCCTVKAVKMLIDHGADVRFSENMIFGTEPGDYIWDGGDTLPKITPRPEMIEYLKTIR
jgi:ankyrin repeat protein